MATGWKRIAERVLAAGTRATGTLGRRRHDVSILAYHNIVPRGEKAVGDRSLHLDQDVFAAQLDWLADRVEVISLDSVLEPTATRRPRAVITFDDAYRGTMTAGIEELARRGLPATVFVPPGLLGAGPFWWDALSPAEDSLDPAVRDRVLTTLRGLTGPAREWAGARGHVWRDMPEHAEPVTPDELDAQTYEHLSLGAHTWSHPSLPRLSDDDLERQLSRSKAWLEERATHTVDWLAYPYGHWDERVAAAAARHFTGALRVDGGPWRPGADAAPALHSVPRINVPRGLTLDGLLLRLTGLID